MKKQSFFGIYDCKAYRHQNFTNVWKNLLLRNVAGFLNGINKGKIVIGVSNDGEIEGINNELKVLDRTGKSSVDRFTRNISIEINCKLNNAEFYTTINSINIKENIDSN